MTEYSYRWIRTGGRGKADPQRVKHMEAQGWEPVPPDELPPPAGEPEPPADDGRARRRWHMPDLLDPHDNGVAVGGLRYYRMPTEMLAERNAHFAKRHAGNLRIASGEIWFRDNAEPRMAKFAEVETDHTRNEGYGPDRPNVPTATAAEYYGEMAIAEHPERAAELAEYEAHLASKGVCTPVLWKASGLTPKPRRGRPPTK